MSLYLVNNIQLSPEGEMKSGNYYREAQRWGIYLAPWTDPEGDSCFRVYKNSWIEMKQVPFFTILVQIQHQNHLLPTSKYWQAKVRGFLGICLYDCFIYRSNFVFRKCFETRRHIGSGRKTVNSQGYSEIREPIKTRENWNCYSLIWSIN